MVEGAPTFISVERHQDSPPQPSTSHAAGQETSSPAPDTVCRANERGFASELFSQQEARAPTRAQEGSALLPQVVEVSGPPLPGNGVMGRVVVPGPLARADVHAVYPLRASAAAQAQLANFLQEVPLRPVLPQHIEIKLNRNFLPEMRRLSDSGPSSSTSRSFLERSAINRLFDKWRKVHAPAPTPSSSFPSSSSSAAGAEAATGAATGGSDDDDVDSISKESQSVENLGLSFVRALRSFVDKTSSSHGESSLLDEEQAKEEADKAKEEREGKEDQALSAAIQNADRKESHEAMAHIERNQEVVRGKSARGGKKVDDARRNDLVGDLKQVEGILQADLKRVHRELRKT
eukprot:748669-Hanusia_phi.AAC.3